MILSNKSENEQRRLDDTSTITQTIPTAFWSPVVLAVILFGGCATQQLTTKPQIDENELTKAKNMFREEINDFVDYFQATVERAAMDLERKSASREQRRASSLLRIRMVSQCRNASDQEDPREALLDLWTLCQRMLDYFTIGEGKSMYGDNHAIAVTMAKDIYTAIENLARQTVSKDSFEKVKNQIVAQASEHPMRGKFSEQPAERLSDDDEGMKLIEAVVGLPFAPLTALSGIGKTSESVRNVSYSMDKFTDVVEDLPANTRWQAQLLAMNLEELPTVQSTSESIKQVADSSTKLAHNSTRFVQVIDDMPVKVRKEAEVLLDRVDALHPEMRTTLGETQKTVELIQAANHEIKDTITEANRTVSNVNEASAALEKTANAVTITAKEILKFVPASMKDETGQIIGKPRNPYSNQHPGGKSTAVQVVPSTNTAQSAVKSKSSNQSHGEQLSSPENKFSFQAVTESANALGETTTKLQGLLTDLRTLFDAKSLSQESNALKKSLVGMVDHVAKRCVQLMVLLFILMLVYTLVRTRLQHSNQRPAGA